MPVKKRIQSFKELHKLAPHVIKEIVADRGLLMRAMANPILALEELGYELSETAVFEVERYLRFSRSSQKALEDLEAEIKKLVGRAVDMSSESAIEKVLFEQLKLKRPGVRVIQPVDVRSEATLRIAKKNPPFEEPLEPLKNDHPVIKVMIEHRKITRSSPPFATIKEYEKLKSGSAKLPISGVKLVFKRSIEEDHEGGDDHA